MPTKGFTDSTKRISFYDPVMSTTYSTSSLWRTCPLLEFLHDPSIGFMLDENFNDYDSSNTYTGTQATTGSAAILTTAPGTLQMNAGATTDNQGFNLQRLKAGFLPASGKDIWAEFNISLTASSPPVTRAQLFVGLAASDTTIIAAGAMTTNDRIGWMILDGGLLVTTFTCDKAGAATTKTGPTLVSATKIRLGFYYDGTADTVQQYVNGAASQTAVTTTNVAKNIMYPSFVCQSDATDQPLLNIHGYRIFQLR